MKKFIILGIFIWLVLSWFANSVGLKADENDTAYTENILPNAGTTSSTKDNFSLDGVNSGTGTLTNNSTHNGFTITCETEINNACGQAFNGELESSRDMKVSASGSLLNLSGTDDGGNSHTSTQAKNNGGVQLTSQHSVQNCESSTSSFACGNSVGEMDSFILKQSIKDKDGNVLATMTTTRIDDAGYNTNSKKFRDNLVYNGLGAYSYEWEWQGNDVSGSSTPLSGTNLLGAELIFEFPTEDYQPLTVQEQANINEALGTTNLNESEIWDVISGIEEKIAMKIYESGVPENTMIEVSLNEEMKVERIITSQPVNTQIINEVIEEVKKEETIETLANEVLAMVQEETKEEKETITEEENNVQETETEQKTETLQAKTKEKIKEEKKTKVVSLSAKLDKVDAVVKEASKNLEVKNLIKLDEMLKDEVSLIAYTNTEFYKPQNIYLNQNLMIDNRVIYANVNLDVYVANDPVVIKERKLNEIRYQKQKLLLEIQELKNG